MQNTENYYNWHTKAKIKLKKSQVNKKQEKFVELTFTKKKQF